MTVFQAYWAGIATGAGTMLLVLGLLWWQEPHEEKGQP
jgi:hypothetical protein